MSDQSPQNTGAAPTQDAPAQTASESGFTSSMPFSVPSGQGSIEDVFLTPRVIDQNAFTRYSETLKTLIREASGSGETLRNNAQSAHVLVEELRAAGQDLRSKIEAGAKLVKMFDERIERTNKALEEAAARAKRVEELDKNIDANVAQRLEAFEARLSGIFDEFESRANQAEQRLVTAEQTALRHAQKLEELSAQLEERVREFEERSSRVVAEADSASGRIAERAESLTRGLEERATELKRLGEPAERLCRRTLEALSLDPDNPGEDESRAAAFVEGIEQARRQAEEASRRLGETGREADETRRQLASSLVEAAERVEQLMERAAGARQQADQGLESLRSAQPEIESALAAAREQVQALRAEHESIERGVRESARMAQEGGETLKQQKQELESLLDASIQRLGSRVEEAGAWLGGLITRAAQTGQALERVIHRTGISSEHTPHQGQPASAGHHQPTGSTGQGTPETRQSSQHVQTPSWAPPSAQQPQGSRSWAPTPELPRELRDAGESPGA